jgi:hypothetical protein
MGFIASIGADVEMGVLSTLKQLLYGVFELMSVLIIKLEINPVQSGGEQISSPERVKSDL